MRAPALAAAQASDISPARRAASALRVPFARRAVSTLAGRAVGTLAGRAVGTLAGRAVGIAVLACLAGAATAAAPGRAAAHAPQPGPIAMRIARQALPAGDGWASDGTGTTGGSAADAAHVFVASTRDQLAADLAGDTPKIVFISGRIDANTSPDGTPLSCADYADPAYSLDAFLATYDPAVWGRDSEPSGPLEDARVRSTKNQGARVNIRVGANTTIIGLHGGQLVGANLLISNVDNVIVRNVTFADAYDCFPSWDPTDGATGNWNSLYDTVSVIGSTHVWFDHDSFSDGDNPDSAQPVYFGRPFQVHDGLLDITKGADLVTVSACYLHDHDKTMLIGSTDKPTTDVGKLRVTLHGNRFANLGQRAPRVRFGQVDAYNNLYDIPRATGGFATDGYSYSWGVGVQSALHAENNFVVLGDSVDPASVVHYWGGTAMTEKGTLVYRNGSVTRTSLLAAYNAANSQQIGDDAGWTPRLRTTVVPTIAVPLLVALSAGAGRLPI